MRYRILWDLTTEEGFTDECGLMLVLEILTNKRLVDLQKYLVLEMLAKDD